MYWVDNSKLWKIIVFFFLLIYDYYIILKYNRLFMIIILKSNSKIHKKMLNSVLHTKTLFFNINPSGRILNRFSNDINLLDNFF